MQFEEKPGSLCTLISCSSNGYHGHLQTEKITQTAKISVNINDKVSIVKSKQQQKFIK